jgi:FemAB-related protein (PEP-CTERM system-associated)
LLVAFISGASSAVLRTLFDGIRPLLVHPMLTVASPSPAAQAEILVHEPDRQGTVLDRLKIFLASYRNEMALSQDPTWATVFGSAFRHRVFWLEAVAEGQTRGFLTLAYVRSRLFGRFLVSQPYLNYGGVVADDERIARLLIDRAVVLADELGVRHLELRHEQPVTHAALNQVRTDKVHMRLDLPETTEELWQDLSKKVRNQVRKGQSSDLTVAWGQSELVPDFYAVFSRNMRDLGTPVYSRKLFSAITEQFPGAAEIGVVRSGKQPVAAALLLHGRGITEVPSASCLREFNASCANMLLYWHLLERSVQRGQRVFDFGRSGVDSSTFRFKKQWGAEPFSAHWQYYLRAGSQEDMRKENPRYQKFIRIWQKLPVWVTRLVGPAIVRGIP